MVRTVVAVLMTLACLRRVQSASLPCPSRCLLVEVASTPVVRLPSCTDDSRGRVTPHQWRSLHPSSVVTTEAVITNARGEGLARTAPTCDRAHSGRGTAVRGTTAGIRHVRGADAAPVVEDDQGACGIA